MPSDPDRKCDNEYERRGRILRHLGFKSYKGYLASDLWKSIRDRVLERDGHTCRFCGKPATQAHHRIYNLVTMLGKDLRHLFAVCAGCHRDGEFRERDNLKLSPKQATAKMRLRRTLRLKQSTGN